MRRLTLSSRPLLFLLSAFLALPLLLLASPPAHAAPFPAVEGDCFNYSLNDMRGVWQMSNISTNCGAIHTAQTIYVGRSRSLTSLPPAGKLTSGQVNALPPITADLATCRQAVKQAVGKEAELSRYGFNAIYQVSTEKGVDLRCDLVLYTSNGRSLQKLSTPYNASRNPWCAKIISGGGIKYVKCGTANSGVAEKSGYLNFSYSKPYPGADTVRSLVIRKCQGYDFWGYNPSKEGWRTGGHYTCYKK